MVYFWLESAFESNLSLVSKFNDLNQTFKEFNVFAVVHLVYLMFQEGTGEVLSTKRSSSMNIFSEISG